MKTFLKKTRPAIVFLASTLLILAMILFIIQPATERSQFVLDLFLLAVFLVSSRKPSLAIRIFLAGVVFAVGSRYFYWRLTNTIYGTWEDILASTLLVLAELYTFITIIIGFLQTVSHLPRRPVLLPDDPQALPTVDVFVPTYNEPLHIVRTTLLGTLNIDYPKDRLNIYLLDDGKRDEFSQLATDLGIHYLTREDNRFAKAGNLNNAYKNTAGELIAVFDCDHIPAPDFLTKTVGGFLKDPKLGVIQSPHHFYNNDPFERNLKIKDEVPNESELFYYVIQPGNDLWNAAFFCGSAGVLRRKALDEIGGFQTDTVTEDAHTSIILHSKGWNSAYIRAPLTSGLAVETLADMITQRTRWCRGMIQIFRRANPLLLSGLTFFQRLIYLNTIMYWFFAIPRLIFLTAPLWYLYLGIYSLHASFKDILLYLSPYIILTVKTNRTVYGRYRHSFWSEIYETAFSYFLILPAITALFNSRPGAFKTTPKGSRIQTEFFDINLVFPSMLLLLLNLGGIGIGVYKLVQPSGDTGILLMNIFWAFYNVSITTLSVSTAIEGRQIRKYNRIFLNEEAFVYVGGGLSQAISGKIADISMGGLKFTFPSSAKTEILFSNQEINVQFDISSTALVPAQIVDIQRSPEGTVLNVRFPSLTMNQEKDLVMKIFGSPSKMFHRVPRTPDRFFHTLYVIFQKSFLMMGWMIRKI
ncbi:MAG: UDP-forming cellulose synthase catalytic subunit [Leptospirales bacterium]